MRMRVKATRSMALSQRRAQLTLFIIIALVLLFSSIVAIYIAKEARKISLTKEEVEKVSLESKPIKRFVESCLYDELKEGVYLAGQRGGFINESLLDSETARFLPLSSNVLLLGTEKVPFWFYSEYNRDVIGMPELHKSSEGDMSIEDQLDAFIGRKLPGCIKNFEDFSSHGINVTPLKEPVINVHVYDDSVVAELDYPLKITISNKEGSSKESISKFRSKIPVRLGRIYEVAKGITTKEARRWFIEHRVLSLISIYSGLNSELLPPIYDSHIGGCGDQVFWDAFSVKENLIMMLSMNIPFFKVMGSDFTPISASWISNPDERHVAESMFRSFIIRLNTTADLKGIKTHFSFTPDMPSSFDFEDANGKHFLLSPNSLSVPIPFYPLCMDTYQTLYSAKFPIVVDMADRESLLYGQPYDFRFALEAVIVNNFPRAEYLTFLNDTNLRNMTVFEGADRYECSELDKNSLIFVLAKDRVNNKHVNNAAVFYQCGAVGSRCPLGLTENGALLAFVKSCTNGVLSIQKNNYLTFIKPLAIKANNLTIVVANMTPLRKIPFSVKKIYVKPPAPQLSSGEQNADEGTPGVVIDEDGNVIKCNIAPDDKKQAIGAHEEVMVKMYKSDFRNGIMDREIVTLFNGSNSYINIAPGRYEGQLLLMKHESYAGEMLITKGSSSMDISLGPFRGTKRIEIPDKDIEVKTALIGGAALNFTLGDELYKANNITFTVIYEDAPRTVYEIGQPLSHIEACTLLNREKLKPVLS